MKCPKCQSQLTSLLLCPECGLRYDDLEKALLNWYEKRRALLAVEPGLRGETLYGEFNEAEWLLAGSIERELTDGR